MEYRIPELDELDEIGQRIQQIVRERNPKARLVQVPLEKKVAEYEPAWRPVYINEGGSEYSVFVAHVPDEPGLGIVDIEKRTVRRKLS